MLKSHFAIEVFKNDIKYNEFIRKKLPHLGGNSSPDFYEDLVDVGGAI